MRACCWGQSGAAGQQDSKEGATVRVAWRAALWRAGEGEGGAHNTPPLPWVRTGELDKLNQFKALFDNKKLAAGTEVRAPAAALSQARPYPMSVAATGSKRPVACPFLPQVALFWSAAGAALDVRVSPEAPVDYHTLTPELRIRCEERACGAALLFIWGKAGEADGVGAQPHMCAFHAALLPQLAGPVPRAVRGVPGRQQRGARGAQAVGAGRQGAARVGERQARLTQGLSRG